MHHYRMATQEMSTGKQHDDGRPLLIYNQSTAEIDDYPLHML